MKGERVANLSELDEGPYQNVASSMWTYLNRGYHSHPKGVAVTSLFQSAGHLQNLTGPSQDPNCTPYLSWTHTQLRRAAFRLSNFLDSLQIPEGSTLANLTTNCAETAILIWVCALRQIAYVPLDPRSLQPSRRSELKFFVSNLKPTIIVIDSEEGMPAITETFASLGHSLAAGLVRSSSTSLPSLWHSLPDIPPQSDTLSRLEPTHDDPSQLTIVFFTSGTSTGTPKGCPLTAKQSSAMTSISPRSRHIHSPEDVYLLLGAQFRIISWLTSVSAWSCGASMLMPAPAFSPEAILLGCEAGVTHMVLMPYGVHVLGECETYSSERVAGVKTVLLGGDVLTVPLLEKARQLFPKASVSASHGMTEGGTEFTTDLPGLNVEKTWGRIITLGKLLPGPKVKIVKDNVSRELVRRGDLGEMHLGGNQFIDGYLGGVRPELFYKDDGGSWFVTGDLGLVDEEDHIFVVGRSKDVVKRAGIPISPAALQSALNEAFGIAVEIIGLPSEKCGEVPWAVVRVLPDGAAEADMQKCILDNFGPDYTLEGVLSLKQLGFDDFPLNATGKVLRLDLQNAAIKLLNEKKKT